MDDRIYHRRVAVTERANGYSAGKIEIPFPIPIPHLGASTSDGPHVVAPIVGQHVFRQPGVVRVR
jgi:hypothetical protein